MAYARMAAKKEEGHGVVATSKYCAKAIEDDEDEDDANEEEDNRVGMAAEGDDGNGDDDDLDAFEALFRPLSSSPTLRFVASRRSRLPPSLSLLSPASTPDLLTQDLLGPGPRLELEPRYTLLHALQSPTVSCASSWDTSSAPATPTTSQGFTFPFPTMRSVDETEATPVMPRLHLRPNPRPRTQFRTLSASITARSPLSLSFPLSLSLPLSARRASSLGTMMSRYMEEQGKRDEDGVDRRSRAGRDVAGAAAAGEVEDQGIVDGEDPFGTHGRAYYTPRAREALGFGDAYDLSAWEWACDYSPSRREKKKWEEMRHVHAGAATTDGTGTTRSGPGSVYHTPVYAASAPQLSCDNRPDKELEYLRAIAKSRARGRLERPAAPVRLGSSTRDPRDHKRTPGHRSGIRPLLLPQKLGLPGSGVPVQAREADSANNALHSGGRGHGPTGWEWDLERGVSGDA
jgi:hypothetical protein